MACSYGWQPASWVPRQGAGSRQHTHPTAPLPAPPPQPDPTLRALLDSIPLPKHIFTNADRKHAERCLDLLGIRSCFDSVICFEDVMEAAEQVGASWGGHQGTGCRPPRALVCG